jgi:hypothetical protein
MPLPTKTILAGSGTITNCVTLPLTGPLPKSPFGAVVVTWAPELPVFAFSEL